MKVLAAVILVLGSASAFRSGPYLPSGWRPDGPAFLLPSEPRPPVVAPPDDFILQGSEASSSDFLREYGPPKIQSLPEVATEQPFVVLQARITEEENGEVETNAEIVEAATQVIDLKYDIEETASEAAVTEAAVEVQVSDDTTPKAIQSEEAVVELRSSNLEVASDGQTEGIQVEQTVEASGELKADLAAAVQEIGEVQTELTEEVKTVEEGVKNIAEAIVSLEQEVVAEQVQVTQDNQQTVELKSGNLEQVPEGFLEYGPPGFREYGPPNLIPRTADDAKAEEEKIQNNETRRRRFSPKFRTVNAKKH